MSETTTADKPTIERLSFDDMYDTITGHEARAVEKAFDGVTVDELMLRFAQGELDASGVVVLVQAMEFLVVKRENEKLSDEKALAAVLDLKRGELLERTRAYMAEDAEQEPFPEEPVTEAGKEDSSPA